MQGKRPVRQVTAGRALVLERVTKGDGMEADTQAVCCVTSCIRTGIAPVDHNCLR